MIRGRWELSDSGEVTTTAWTYESRVERVRSLLHAMYLMTDGFSAEVLPGPYAETEECTIVIRGPHGFVHEHSLVVHDSASPRDLRDLMHYQMRFVFALYGDYLHDRYAKVNLRKALR